MAFRWKNLFYRDLTGLRVRKFPVLERFGDAMHQDRAFRTAQMRALRNNPRLFLTPIVLVAAAIVVGCFIQKYIWLTILANTACGIWFTWRLQKPIRRELYRMLDEDIWCPSCDYVLVGNESGLCPECGTEIAQAQRQVISTHDELRAGLNPIETPKL
jgi:hypothetical protein